MVPRKNHTLAVGQAWNRHHFDGIRPGIRCLCPRLEIPISHPPACACFVPRTQSTQRRVTPDPSAVHSVNQAHPFRLAACGFLHPSTTPISMFEDLPLRHVDPPTATLPAGSTRRKAASSTIEMPGALPRLQGRARPGRHPMDRNLQNHPSQLS